MPIDQECPKRDISLALNVSKTDVCAGETVSIAPTASLPDGSALQWTVNGDAVSQMPTLDFNTTGRAPGSYKIGMKVTADGFNDAIVPRANSLAIRVEIQQSFKQEAHDQSEFEQEKTE